MRHRPRLDANHAQIVSELRQLPGISVLIVAHMGGGAPDVIVGYDGQNLLVEIKDGAKPPSRRKLTADESWFFKNWQGRIIIATSTEDVLIALNYRRNTV
jgi:hypothetical protein